jgi:crossover junction endodeoxyribonuclease RuvC
MQMMVKTILHLDETPKPDDAADALAAAICHGHSAAYHKRMEEVAR